MNEKKKKIIITSLAFCSILLIVAGSTYAYWTLTRKQGDTNVVTASCLDFDLTSVNSGINVNSAWPIKDGQGKESTGYTFTVTNNCDKAVDYNVEFEKLSSSTIPDKYIRFDLDYTASNTTLKDRTDTIYYMDDGSEGKILDSYTVAANGTNTHTLRLWIDEYTPVGYQSKTYRGKISIVGGQGIKAPQIFASEAMDEHDTISYTWYDNGDLFIEDLGWEYAELTGYLINKYVQEDPKGIFTTEEKTYLQNYYWSEEKLPDELYVAIVDKPDVAYYKNVDNTELQSIIDSPTNANFKSDVLSSIDDGSKLKTLFPKISDNMPRFNNIYINAPESISSNLLRYMDAQRLAINIYGEDAEYYFVAEYSFLSSSFETIDFRLGSGPGEMVAEMYAFAGLYAPNATFVVPDLFDSSSYRVGIFAGMWIDTLELLNNRQVYKEFAHINTIIFPESQNNISFSSDHLSGNYGDIPLSQLSDINIKIRGPQRTITGFTPGDFKSVTWNYSD